METQGINLFIVDDNNFTVAALKQFLQNKFGVSLQISTFKNGQSCLEKVDEETHIVILDYFLEGKNGLETLKSIKTINPKTEVIMLSGNEDMAIAIETFRAGAADYVIKNSGYWNRLAKLVSNIITAPIRLLVREFRVSKFMAIFLLTFVTMAIVVVVVMRWMKW